MNTEDIKKEENLQEEQAPMAEETQEQPTDENVAQAETQEQPDELQLAREEAEKWKDKCLRTAAEFDNYKKRSLKEKTELILNGGEKVITAILPVIDDIERALANAQSDPESVREGVKLIHQKFMKTLESLGVKTIETVGNDFNVDFHEAIAMVPGMPDEQKGKVIDCVQTGYMLNDKVIRYAKVAVGQ